jgi:hypothetical protein
MIYVDDNLERDYGRFTVSWDFRKNRPPDKAEEEFIVTGVESILPRLAALREQIFQQYQSGCHISTTILYPFKQPKIKFDLWYDPVAQGYGLHIWEYDGRNPIGSVHFHHEKEWL